jgi:hypothetical protein
LAFNAEQYRAASLEHLKLAGQLLDEERYLLSHYLSGLSVECMLRAYRFRIDQEFDGRHNLEILFRESGYEKNMPKAMRERVSVALNVVQLRWKNDYRFRCTEDLTRYLYQIKAHRGLIGDLLLESNKLLYEAANVIVEFGDKKWQG